ncbi:MAG: hypothetical protein PUG97_02340 [bacterium]|nr:hypothetical protein [bacterium]
MKKALMLLFVVFAITGLCSCDNKKKITATDFHCAQHIDVRR